MKLLEARAKDGIPGFFMALRNCRTDAITAFVPLLKKLSDKNKMAIITDKSDTVDSVKMYDMLLADTNLKQIIDHFFTQLHLTQDERKRLPKKRPYHQVQNKAAPK
jgi:archaellum biogenesis ATPase FlaH